MGKMKELRPRIRRMLEDDRRAPIAAPLPVTTGVGVSCPRPPSERRSRRVATAGSTTDPGCTVHTAEGCNGGRKPVVSSSTVTTTSEMMMAFDDVQETQANPGASANSGLERGVAKALVQNADRMDASPVKEGQRSQRARLFLLQQTGSSSFLVAGENVHERFIVTIGPQTCSCGRSPTCIHLLFIMLRVLQADADDERLLHPTLSSSDVDTLMTSYTRRRYGSMTSHSRNEPGAAAAGLENTGKCTDGGSVCAICMLESCDGVDQVWCTGGCNSYLHQPCLTVWLDECRQRREPARCPRCHSPWPPSAAPAPVAAADSTPVAAADLAPVAAADPAPVAAADLAPVAAADPAPVAVADSTPVAAADLAPVAAADPAPVAAADPAPVAAADPAPVAAADPAPRPRPRSSSRRRASNPSLCGARSAGRGSNGSLSSTPLVDPRRVYSPQLGRRGGGLGGMARASCASTPVSPVADQLSADWQPTRRLGRGSQRPPTMRLERLESVERRQIWSQMLGRDLVQMIFSRDWQSRDSGLNQLREDLMSARHRLVTRSSAGDFVLNLLDLLATLCADPVHKVFQSSINCVGALLQPVTRSCAGGNEVAGLWDALTPLVDALLLRSADANRRCAHLSIWTLEQLALGADGQLVTGDVAGLALVLERLLQECRSGSDTWQWVMGRIVVAARLIRRFPRHFELARPHGVGCPDRLQRLAEFSQRALKHPHPTVSQLASGVFVHVALSAAYDPGLQRHIKQLMEALDPVLSGKVRRHIQWEMELRRTDGSGAAAARTAGSCPATPSIGSSSYSADIIRRPRPNYLPLDTGAGAKRKRVRHQLRAQGLTPTAAVNTSAARLLSCLETPAAGSSLQAARNSPVSESRRRYRSVMTRAAEPSNHSVIHDYVVFPHEMKPEVTGGGERLVYTESVNWMRGFLLGSGAFSSCWQAQDQLTGRLMAVKQLPLSSVGSEERACEELRLLSTLHHGRLVRLLGATRRAGVLNLFVEWEAGGSVSSLLERFGAMSCHVIRRYGSHMLEGLTYLHEQRVIHRDLKGANLLVDSTGQWLKVADLGTAAVLRGDVTLHDEFTGQMFGTVAFMAPEVLRGQHYGRASDIWSVGCCIIEMATARPPWDAHDCSNHFALLFKIAGCNSPPELPGHLPDDLKQLVTDCHRMQQEQRPRSRELLLYPSFNTSF